MAILNMTGEVNGEQVNIHGARVSKLHAKKFQEFDDKYYKVDGEIVSSASIDKKTGNVLEMGYNNVYIDAGGNQYTRKQLETWIIKDGKDMEAEVFEPTLGEKNTCPIQKVMSAEEGHNYLIESMYALDNPDPANQIYKFAKMLWDTKQVAMVPWISRATIQPTWAIVVPMFRTDGTYQLYFNITKAKITPGQWIGAEPVPKIISTKTTKAPTMPE